MLPSISLQTLSKERPSSKLHCYKTHQLSLEAHMLLIALNIGAAASCTGWLGSPACREPQLSPSPAVVEAPEH